jgi:hypothetical protein
MYYHACTDGQNVFTGKKILISEIDTSLVIRKGKEVLEFGNSKRTPKVGNKR